MDIIPVGLELLSVGHMVGQRRMPHDINPVSGLLELRRDDLAGVHCGNAEGDEGRGDIDDSVGVLERAAHGILSSNGGQSEGGLHLEGSEKGAQRQSPGVGIPGHALEILLIGESHAGPVGSGGDHLGAGFHHRVGGTVIGAPGGDVGVIAPCHDAGGVGVAADGHLLHGDLGLGALGVASERHQDGGTAHCGVEHLDEPLLGSDIGQMHHGLHLSGHSGALHLEVEGSRLRHGGYGGAGMVLRSGAVDELAREVGHDLSLVIHPHAAGVCDLGDMGDFYVVRMAEVHELLHVLLLHHDGHSLLRLADCELGAVKSGIFHGHPVQPDVKSGGELAYGHAHSAGSEVVGLLDETGCLGMPEQALYLSLLGSVTLLDLAAAGLERLLGVLLGRTGGTSDSVATGASAQQQNHVARGGALPSHVRSLHGAHDCAHLHSLGGVAVMEDFPDMGGGQTYLVAIGRISRGSLAAYDSLGKLSLHCLGHRLADVAGAGHAHGLIDICTARERVSDGSAQTGGSASEGLDFGGVVVGLVLELEEPGFLLAVHIHIHADAAGIVLLALLLVVEDTLFLQPAGSDGGQLHETEALTLASKFPAHGMELAELALDLALHEGVVHGDGVQLGVEGGVAAVVAPVGVEYPQLGLGGVPLLIAEVLHHLGEVVGVHGQAPLGAECGIFLRLHGSEAFQDAGGTDLGLVGKVQLGKVLLAGLHRIDIIMADSVQSRVRHVVVKYYESRAADHYVCGGVDQMHAVLGGRGSLVELAGDVFHGEIFLPLQRAAVGDHVGHGLSENGVAALLEKLRRETEKVIDIYIPEGTKIEGEVLVEFVTEAVRLDSESGALLHKDSGGRHIRSRFEVLSLPVSCGTRPAWRRGPCPAARESRLHRGLRSWLR